jgi:hypothetical protein
MALTFTEINSVTNDYFSMDNKKATDIYFYTSFFMEYFMKQKKGYWDRFPGGPRIRVPLVYDVGEGGFYTRSGTLSSDDKVMVNSAFFYPKHMYGNATMLYVDEQENMGPQAEVKLVVEKIEGAQKKCSKDISSNVYNAAVDTATSITGLSAMTGETATTAYGGIQEADLVSADGTKPWEGKTTTTTEGISLAVIRTLASLCKLYDGPFGKPDIGLTTETLFNILKAVLQTQQRFEQDTDTAKAGFTHLVFEQQMIAVDDFCPSGEFYALNSKHVGFAIHNDGYFARTPWYSLLPAGINGRSMKIFWDGNLVCTNRKAHARHTNLS